MRKREERTGAWNKNKTKEEGGKTRDDGDSEE